MKFLIDNALSPIIGPVLSEGGHDVKHVRDLGMQSAIDSDVIRVAEDESRILVSADTDFGALLALRHSRSPSFVLFRKASNLRPIEIGRHLVSIAEEYTSELTSGCVLTITDEKIRVRRLPIG